MHQHMSLDVTDPPLARFDISAVASLSTLGCKRVLLSPRAEEGRDSHSHSSGFRRQEGLAVWRSSDNHLVAYGRA